MRPISFLASALAFAISAIPAHSEEPLAARFGPLKIQGPALYVVGYSHLDTEWCWNYPQVIREFIPNTLHENFSLFEKYPDYVFNWTGANRYRFMKEYYPADYAKLKEYVKAGKWFPDGSSLEELDVNNPDAESILRQVLYGNEWFQRELGTCGVDFILPDCFGFPASLPSILHHAGVKGFSTQKLTWGSAVGIPFNFGVWKGPDGQGMVSALNAGAYDEDLEDDASHDQKWIDRVTEDAIKIDYRYFGVGDRGGAPTEKSVKNLELSLHSGGPLKVIGGRADQIFRDVTPDQVKQLPVYQGDLELTQHSAGSLTSESEMKRWNHKNELLADAAERTSLIADWIGALPYDKARLTDAWMRFLPGQFHDLMAGTALPRSYEFAWNDQVVAANEFSGVLAESVGAAVRGLDTRAAGAALVVYNPLSRPREDVTEATVHFPGAAPASLVAVDAVGRFSPVQVLSRSGHDAKILILAKVPAVGFSVYDIRPISGAVELPKTTAKLSVSSTSLENGRYIVKVDSNGDISSVFDKTASKELLASPSRLAYVHHNPDNFPAWNMDWRDAKQQPRAYVGHPVSVKVVENGPVRVALQIVRESEGNRFTQTVRLSAGGAGNRVEINQKIDWRGKESALKATFPLTVSNPLATYNWGMGTVQRGTNDPKKYEVASHDWMDLTDTSGQYGVTILPGFKFGSDKPSDNELRLTLLYTPGTNGGYQHQGTQDWGHHDFTYGLAGHTGSWSDVGTEWEGLRLNQPPIAFQADAHSGRLGRNFSFLRVSDHNVAASAVKQAERSKEIIVRLQELGGKPAPDTHVAFASPVLSAREVNGQEQTIGSAKVVNGQLVFDAGAYSPHAFAVTLAPAPGNLKGVVSHPLALPYNTKGFSSGFDKADANFDGAGDSIPGELVPSSILSNGIRFAIGAHGPGKKETLIPRGKTIQLPAGRGRTLYVLGASVDHDRSAIFKFGNASTSVKFQAWNGFVGQWDKRLWDGPQPELTYGWDLHLAGLVHGYVKPAQVAWYADHKRLPSGKNDPYAFAYLFSNRVSVPDGAKSVTLPSNGKLRIVAATVAQNWNETSKPAQPLFDTLEHGQSDAPKIMPSSGTFTDATPVKFEEPLYWNASEPLHYTLDGTDPTAQSPTYHGSMWLSKSATIKVAQVDSSGNVGKVASAYLEVHDTTPPKVVTVTGFPDAPFVRLSFSEPLEVSTASNPTRYKINGESAQSAALSPDRMTVVLQLAKPLTGDAKLTILGVTDSAETPNPVSPEPLDVTVLKPVFARPEETSYDGVGRGTTVRASNLPVEASANWTINQFVYLNEAPKDLTIVSGFGDGRDRNGAERFLINNLNQIFFWGSDIDISGGVPFDRNRWQMITISYDGSTVRIYKDGKLLKTGNATFQPASSLVRLAPNSAWGDGSRFKGKIAGFSIWNVALPQESIQALQRTGPQ